MGTQFRHTCPNCRYWVNVAGGGNAGDFTATETIHCEDCRRLYGMVVTDRLYTPPRRCAPMCPKSTWHRVRLWSHPGSCPKYGATMKRARETLIWD